MVLGFVIIMNLKIGTRPLLLTGRIDGHKASVVSPSQGAVTNTAKVSRKSPLVRDITKNFPSQHLPKMNIRDFFDNFDDKCQIRYESVREPQLEAKRKLQNQLEALVTPASSHQNYQQYDLRPDLPPITFNFSSYPHSRPSNNDPYSSQDSRLQRIDQRLKKINSLTHLQSPIGPNNFKNQYSIRRPGFIRISKSFKRRNRSMQCMLGKQHQAHHYSNPSLSLSLHSSSNKDIPPNAAKSSLQKLSKIRRELTSIYQQRTLRPQLRLRLS